MARLCSDVKRLAELSKINLNTDEAKQMEKDLSQMIKFTALPEKLTDLESETADKNSVDLLRADKIKKSINRDLVLGNAPVKKDGFILVPEIDWGDGE